MYLAGNCCYRIDAIAPPRMLALCGFTRACRISLTYAYRRHRRSED